MKCVGYVGYYTLVFTKSIRSYTSDKESEKKYMFYLREIKDSGQTGGPIHKHTHTPTHLDRAPDMTCLVLIKVDPPKKPAHFLDCLQLNQAQGNYLLYFSRTCSLAMLKQYHKLRIAIWPVICEINFKVSIIMKLMYSNPLG